LQSGGVVCGVQSALQVPAAGSYSICRSCCGVIAPRHQCHCDHCVAAPSPPPPHLVTACSRHCAAASPGLARPSPPPPHLMQPAPTTTGPGAAYQPSPSYHPSVDDRLEPGAYYAPGSWPDPVSVQCPVHGRYPPFAGPAAAGFHPPAADHLHRPLPHPHQFVPCHHQHQQPLSHIYPAPYGGLQSQYSMDDWTYHSCVEYQQQPQADCQLMSAHHITAPLMLHQLQQHDVPGTGPTDAGHQRLDLSVLAADDADRAVSVTLHQDHLTTTATAAVPTCIAGEICLISCYSIIDHFFTAVSESDVLICISVFVNKITEEVMKGFL